MNLYKKIQNHIINDLGRLGLFDSISDELYLKRRFKRKIPKGFLYAFEADKEAIRYSKNKLEEIGSNFEIIHSNFVAMKKELRQRGVTRVDGILFDLGVSSPQIDSVGRGFSFMRDEELDMRMDQEQSFSAKELVNSYSYSDLVHIFFNYGEEKQSKLIAKKIVEKRQEHDIETTGQLVSIIKEAVGANYFYKVHPERKIFQAIRIEVNQELFVIEKVLPESISLLKKNGRICVITFHSLEDRLVKQIFNEYAKVDPMMQGLPYIPYEYQAKVCLINKKPILPGEEELKNNSRSRSAKLRVIERTLENDEKE